MSLRGAALAVWLCAAALPVHAQTPAAPARRAAERGPTIAVTYRSETSVYVSGGRAAGLAVGDRLGVVSDGQTTAELEVVFLAEHSSSCKIVEEKRPVKAGDRVMRLGAARPAPAPSPSAYPTAPQAGAPAPTVIPPEARRAPVPLARVTGGVTLGWSTFRDSSEAGRDAEDKMARYDLSLRDVGGRPVEARVRGNSRDSVRSNVRGFILPERDRRDRLYEASLAWAPAGGRFSAIGGRLGAHPFVSLGYLDGVLAEGRPVPSLHVGGFAGRTADAEALGGFDGGSKYGGFVRFAPTTGPRAYEVVLAGVRENSGDEVSREYLAQEAHLRSGRLWLHERVEVDLNRGWREERAGTRTQLSDAQVRATWRESPTRSFTVSYDRRRNFWSAFQRGFPTELFDDRVHQSVRADVDLSRPGGSGLWLGGSLRTREGEDHLSFAAHGGLRSPRLLSLAASAEGTVYQTVTTRGLQAMGRVGRDVGKGVRLDATYTFNLYELLGFDDTRMSQWVRLSGYGPFVRNAFVRADVEYSVGDDLKGVRALLEAGYRF
jgi:hypothetical protein